ncbi:hypothetical protein [Vibrio mediterranei]|uniref:hypothetical protein n=1 Tax=Vibrio mediterranei TaxID=689 RepID=UPI004068031D
MREEERAGCQLIAQFSRCPERKAALSKAFDMIESHMNAFNPTIDMLKRNPLLVESFTPEEIGVIAPMIITKARLKQARKVLEYSGEPVVDEAHLRRKVEAKEESFLTLNAHKFYIRIPLPCGETDCHAVPVSRGISHAKNMRDKLGRKVWGEFWDLLVQDQYVLCRIPRTFEPTLVSKSKSGYPDELFYETSIRQEDGEGRYVSVTHRAAVEEHGLDGAYHLMKSKKINAYADYLSLFKFLKEHGRSTVSALDLEYGLDTMMSSA